MLKTLKDLFDSFTAPASDSPVERAHTVQLATAVLLVEVMRADPAMDPAETQAVTVALNQKFKLADDEIARLMELATQTAETLYDYHRFTSRLNEQLTHEEKSRIVENMWQVAYADTHLDANENHLIGKVAGLLYVTQGEYIGAKMRAKEAAGLV